MKFIDEQKALLKKLLRATMGEKVHWRLEHSRFSWEEKSLLSILNMHEWEFRIQRHDFYAVTPCTHYFSFFPIARKSDFDLLVEFVVTENSNPELWVLANVLWKKSYDGAVTLGNIHSTLLCHLERLDELLKSGDIV